jgi:CarD family transcriptional regulator
MAAKKIKQKKAPAKKIQAKKTPAKKTATKKTVAKKAPAKKAPAKKIAKKSPVKKPAAKKPAIKKPAAKKTVAKKVKKTAAKKKPAPKKKVEAKTVSAKKEVKVTEKAPEKKLNFKVGDYAVYPSHGIGRINEIQTTEVLGQNFDFYLMFFEKEKLTVKVPVINSQKIGLRPLASKEKMDEVFAILRSGVKKMKGMWSRRAQEYELKINSGDIMALAEVLRDLARDIEDGERSYSERIIYETAVSRLAAEYGVIHKIDFEKAKEEVISTAKDKLSLEEKERQRIVREDFDDDFDDEIEDDDDDDDDDSEDDDIEDFDDEDEDD